MANQTSAANSSSLRKISEDPKLRPFLSSLFDPQNYVRTVIREGKSEESFANIVDGVADINYEIKGYISQHKDDLMSGMQDVAILAERYANLSTSSQSLHGNIEKLKKEIFDSHSLVSSKTSELERIHETSILLQQLKQFVNAKSQLDVYLRDTKDKDMRNMASITKTLNDLEKLLENPKLLEIHFVREHSASIKVYGQNIRLLAQERMLSSVVESNQAAIANSLQVFYNLGCLPEIVLMVIDSTAKAAMDVSKSQIDFDLLTSAYAGQAGALGGVGGASGSASRSSGALSTPAKGSSSSSSSTGNLHGAGGSSANLLAGGATSGSGAVPSSGSAGAMGIGAATVSSAVMSAVQQRLATREVAHSWYAAVLEKALQIHVLQRVLAKKEDPTTHEQFSHVLRRAVQQQQLPGVEKESASASTHGSSSECKSSSTAGLASSSLSALLSSGQLVELFWQRFAAGLLDVSAEKLRKYPNTAIKAYPYLRRAAVEVVVYIRGLGESPPAAAGGGGGGLSGVVRDRRDVASALLRGVGDPAAPLEVPTGSMFGCSLWSQDDFLGSVGGTGSLYGTGNSSRSGSSGSRALLPGTLLPLMHDLSSASTPAANNSPSDLTATTATTTTTNRNGGSVAAASDNIVLLRGLGPLRDRYLLHSQQCMTAPIQQMFPELDGYTAAVPSKRDLQTYIKAIHAEFVIAMVEGEAGLLHAVCGEFIKTVKMMLAKVEGMILAGADARKISSQNAFARTGQQEHNAQLFALLMQLKEALDKMPGQVVRTVRDQSTGSVATGVSSAGMMTAVAAVAAGSSSGLSSASPTKGSRAGSGSGSGSGAASTAESAEAMALQTLKTQLQQAMQGAQAEIDALAQKEFLEPTVALLSGYIKSVLLSMHKEAVISKSKETLECSSAVNTLVKQFPVMLNSYLFSLPASANVNAAVEEICLRTLHSYMSIAALLRPASELMRLRTAKDMAALEMLLLSGNFPFSRSAQQCPVQQEFRAFRRLLFVADDIAAQTAQAKSSSSSGGGGGGTEAAAAAKDFIPPTFSQLKNLPYISQLRPSSVLGYLLTCGPSQLPSPADLPGSSLQTYIEIVTDTTEMALLAAKQKHLQQQMQFGSAGETVGSAGAANTVGDSIPQQMSTTVRLLYITRTSNASGAVLSGWKKVDNERRSWEYIQQCLDVLFRRISVTDGAAQKMALRSWYENVMDIGSQYHGSGGALAGSVAAAGRV